MTNPDTPGPTAPSRRQALCGLAAALFGTGALAACTSSTPSTSGGGSGQSVSSAGGGALAKLSDVPVGSGKVVDGPSGKIMLLRPSESEVKAVSAVCPHAGATVSPPSGGVITCPLHGSKFDGSTGELRGGPATEGLATVSVTVQGDDIVAA